MSLPTPNSREHDWGDPAAPVNRVRSTSRGQIPSAFPPVTRSATSLTTAPEPRGLSGGWVVTIATLIVVAVALLEVVREERIGLWTDIALLSVAIVGPLVTRAGDRSLPAMMPPLAFLAAAVIAGQALLPAGDGSIWSREALTVVQVLGENAAWVVAATVASTVIATTRHLHDRRRK